MKRLRAAWELVALFARLAFALFVLLPVILLDDWIMSQRRARRPKRGG